MDSNGGATGGVSGGKRKIEDEIELAKQKAQAIAARILSDADAKRPRTDSSTTTSSLPPSDYSSPSYPVSSYTQTTTSQYTNTSTPTSRKIQIPNGKVGVIIGRGGDMIKNLQLRSGARIQITRDHDADPSSLTRDVELMGSQDQISRAEHLINEVIAESDVQTAGGPAGNRPPPPLQPGAEQFVIKVPNDKVALVIGKGGETIKTMQNNSGARIQVVPLHLPPGDTSTERNVYINGTKEQIEAAKELVNEVISGNRLKVLSGGNTYSQSAYPPSAGWAPQGQPPAQQPPVYGYTQPGAYAMPPPPYYGGYAPQPGWDAQSNPTAPGQQQNTGYNAYGQQAPPTSTPANVGYNYSQPPAASYNYGQGYPPQPPSYGQDMSGQPQATDPAKPYAPAYGQPPASSQPDGSAAAQATHPGYGAPAVAGQPDGTAQSQAPTYATGYNQGTTAPANGYGAYPSYSTAVPPQPAYSQTGYPQTGYGQQQQDGQVANQASYPYYGQSGYPPTQAPGQASYYQGAYSAIPPPQAPPQAPSQGTNGVPQTSAYGTERTDGGETAAGSGAQENDKPQN